ncbi:hypothetical protein Pelo_15266 [Pelomyxa schiedti]|nr:hypothetical protein Pelo_15266 [Pelomyxa schiedti]
MKPKRSWAEPKCPVHPNKDLDIWCEDDKTLCCLLCKEESHKGHNVSFRDDAHSTAVKAMLESYSNIKAIVQAGSSKVEEEQKAQDQHWTNKRHISFRNGRSTRNVAMALAKSTETKVAEMYYYQQISAAIEHLQKCDDTFAVLQTLSLLKKEENVSGGLVSDLFGEQPPSITTALALGSLTFVGQYASLIGQTNVAGVLLLNDVLVQSITYVVKVRGLYGNEKRVRQQPHNVSAWFERSFTTHPRQVFSRPGRYTFTIPAA